MSTTIDSLQIEIQSSSSNAAKGIDALAKSLEGLKKNGSFKTVSTNLNNLSEALNKLPNVHSASNALRTLANSIENLKGVGTVSGLSNSLAKLPAALKSLGNIDIEKVAPQIRNVAYAVLPLSAIKSGGLNTMVNAMKNLGKVADSLDDETIGRFAEKVELLNEKLGPLSAKMANIKSGFNAINSSARSATKSVDDFGDGINTTSLNMSSFLDVARTVVDTIQGIVQGFSNLISGAIEWDGIAARFGRGFGSEAQETYDWILRLNKEMGINVQQFMQYSSVYATMLNGFGVATEDAAKMALGYMELTYDIWAGYNDVYGSLEETAEAVKSAIAGEVEPVRRAGFTIVEANLEQTAERLQMEKEALRQAVNDAALSGDIESWKAQGVITELTGKQAELNAMLSSVSDSALEQTAANHNLSFSLANATEAEKSYLRYLTLVDQAHSQGLVGTYAKELNTAEGMMRTFNQQLKSLSQAFGSLFLPILIKVMPYVQAFVSLLEEGVHWLAAFFGIEIQKVDFSNIENGNKSMEGMSENGNKVNEEIEKYIENAKDLKNAMLGIDELNVISPPSSSDSNGSNGGSGGNSSLNDIIGEVDSLWNEAIFENIKSEVDAIKEKLRGWLPVIATVSTALAGLRLNKLLKDIKGISKLGSGVAAVGGAFKGIKEFFAAAKQMAPEVGWLAALTPKLSTWIAGIPAALSSAASALAVAGPYIAVAAAVAAGIALAFIDYDFTDIGYKLGEKVGSALRGAAEWIGKQASSAWNWLKDALDIDSFWEFLFVALNPIEFWRRITPEIADVFADISEWFDGKIQNLKGNINEFFGGFFDGLFEGLGVDMSWADKFSEIFDIEYLDIVNMVMNPQSIGKYIMNGINYGIDSNAKLSAIKDKLSSMWEDAKTWWNEKKGSLSTYTPSIGNIASKLSSAWTDAKNWWKDKRGSLSTYTPSIGKIWEKLKTAWTSAKDWWNKSRSNLSYTPSIGSISSKLSSAWTTAKNWWNKSRSSLSYTPSIGSIKDKIVSAWNTAKSWWSKNVGNLSTKINIQVPTISINWKTVDVLGKEFKYPTGFNVKFAANGGIFDQGSLIWAGERGPEVMATAAGGKTGVMNVQQMQDAVYEGVYAAISAAMRGNGNEGGAQAVNVYLDGKVIAKSVEKAQRERGASIMGNAVYSY